MKSIFALMLVLAFFGVISWFFEVTLKWAMKNQKNNWIAKTITLLSGIGMLLLVCLIVIFWIGGFVTSCSSNSSHELLDNCYTDYDRQGGSVVCE